MARLPNQRSANTQVVLQELAEIDRTLQLSKATPPPQVPEIYQVETVVSSSSPSTPTFVNPVTLNESTGNQIPETVVNPGYFPTPNGNQVPETIVNPAAAQASQPSASPQPTTPQSFSSSVDDFTKAKTALKSAWSEGILPGTIALLSSLSLDKAKVAIRNGAIAGAVQASLLLLITLVNVSTSILARSSNALVGSMFDIFLIFGLAFGVYQKNRICAVILFAYFVLSKLVQIFTSPINFFALLVALAFGYFYFEGMRGTFSHYKLTKAQN